MRTEFIRPANPATTVLHPTHGRPLTAEGEKVPWCAYWARHLQAGAIVLVAAPVAPTPRDLPTSTPET